MPYYRPSQERPRQTKRFLTVREVEDMAAAGASEILQVDDLVITDAAREVALDLGMRISQPEPGPVVAARIELPPRRSMAATEPSEESGTPVPSARRSGEILRVGDANGSLSRRRSDPMVRAVVQAFRARKRAPSDLIRKG